ncbi:unnamed protein product [Adineta steineri]|uniref:Uncharacterized protein n=1 Tax=Adineta steineri TaxID=433720 RepID=A0A814I196_9BILA|nr:unnamed protein product [Adineta steineri]CAF4125798.1 unnamed protein product [Adineta steineri]
MFNQHNHEMSSWTQTAISRGSRKDEFDLDKYSSVSSSISSNDDEDQRAEKKNSTMNEMSIKQIDVKTPYDTLQSKYRDDEEQSSKSISEDDVNSKLESDNINKQTESKNISIHDNDISISRLDNDLIIITTPTQQKDTAITCEIFFHEAMDMILLDMVNEDAANPITTSTSPLTSAAPVPIVSNNVLQ